MALVLPGFFISSTIPRSIAEECYSWYTTVFWFFIDPRVFRYYYTISLLNN